MATHSSVLAWRIPGTGEPGGLPSRVAQSRTRLKQLSSSSMTTCILFIMTVLSAEVSPTFLPTELSAVCVWCTVYSYL